MFDDRCQMLSEDSDPCVLVVDDDRGILQMVDDILAPYGIKTQKVTTVSAAEKLLPANRFSLALLDIYLPDGTGLELAREIKSIDAHFPVIIMTGLPNARNVRGAVDVEVDGYLVKPINLTNLIALTEEVMGEYRQRQKEEDGRPEMGGTIQKNPKF